MIATEDDTAYQSFLNKGISGTPEINIILSSDNMPDITGMKKLFDSKESWSMFRKDSDYYISYHPPVFEKPFWISRMNHDFTNIFVYCGNEFIHRENDSTTITNPVRYPLDQIILMYYLAQRRGSLIHAAGIEINGQGYLFAGRSGAGKTTISRQFIKREYTGILSDDRIVIRKIDNKFMIFGTPWPGEGRIAANAGSSLEGIFFLSHGNSNRVEKLTPAQTLQRMLPVTSIPWYDSDVFSEILYFCEELISIIPGYLIHFKPDTEVVDFFENFLAK